MVDGLRPPGYVPLGAPTIILLRGVWRGKVERGGERERGRERGEREGRGGREGGRKRE
jgi:hypothetical protein